MPPIIHIQSALIRRILLLLIAPVLWLLMFCMRLGKAFMSALTECSEMFRAIWHGAENEPELLPCPFCGGRGFPHGWRTQGGATGPACEDCGATTWSAYTWNTRIVLTEKQLASVRPPEE